MRTALFSFVILLSNFIQQIPPCPWIFFLKIGCKGELKLAKMSYDYITSTFVQTKWLHGGFRLQSSPQNFPSEGSFFISFPGKLQLWDQNKLFSSFHDITKYPQTDPGEFKWILFSGNIPPDFAQQVPIYKKILQIKKINKINITDGSYQFYIRAIYILQVRRDRGYVGHGAKMYRAVLICTICFKILK